MEIIQTSRHAITNGANGSVTWCSGPPFCPQCMTGARQDHKFWAIDQHCPGCRCGESATWVVPITTGSPS